MSITQNKITVNEIGTDDTVNYLNLQPALRGSTNAIYCSPQLTFLPSTNTLRATGNITGGNITGGNLNATALSLSGNVVSALNVTGNVAGGNITTAGTANVGTLIATSLVNATATTAATSTTTGAIRTQGGVGVAGNVHVGGALVAVTKSFAIAHPLKADHILYHGCLEGPEHAVYTRGRCQSDRLPLPHYWSALVDTDSITVHLTPMGQCHQVRVVQVCPGEIVLEGSPAIDCFYLIHARRRDVPDLEIEVPGNIHDLYRDH